MPLTPLDGDSCHLQIQKEGCGRARGPPALRKLGQSRLVTSLLMEAASSVWIFLYCRRQCKETSWLLEHFSVNYLARDQSLSPRNGFWSPCPTFWEYRPFSPKASGSLSPFGSGPTLKQAQSAFLVLRFKSQLSSTSTSVYLHQGPHCDQSPALRGENKCRLLELRCAPAPHLLYAGF